MKLYVKIILGFLVLLLSFVGFSFYTLVLPKAISGSPLVVTIPNGSTPKKIASILERKGVINSADIFYTYVKIKGIGRRLRAGSFQLSPSMSVIQVANALQDQNGAALLSKLTIPEGFSAREIGGLLEKRNGLSKHAFYDYISNQAKDDFKEKYPFLNDIPVQTIEGYLFPDTYFYSPGATIREVVDMLLAQFEKRMIPVWKAQTVTPDSPKQRFNFHQVLTIASLIQKEARVISEMPQISSVFYNRLKKRMPLASDPTVVYALGRDYKSRVYYKDLKIDSPYNTYRYSGFPPSPIASMGVKALQASMNPIKGNKLFFVAQSDGSHYFSETYQEHLKIQQKKSKR